ncbi:hypothetical protein I4U23_005099 [Adineta vaga]|nr:hypothetical protein I4U23_005099 [Adineta vaga]
MVNIHWYASALWQKLMTYLKTLNLFPSIPPSTDEHQIRNERISTRIFIFLLTISLTILLLYTSLINITQTVIIEKPTLDRYEQLNSKYSKTLTCPCSKISINYKTFLNLKYTSYEICRSIFVTPMWIDSISTLSDGQTTLDTGGMRFPISYSFETLNVFCSLINENIKNRLIQFYTNQYVTSSVVSEDILKSQVESFISQFISSTTNDFLLSLSRIRDTTQSNSLVSAWFINYDFVKVPGYIDIFVGTKYYRNCSCAFSSTCITESSIFDAVNKTVLFGVPGFFTGCYIIEALLQSDLRCFYDQTCLDRLRTYFFSPSPINFTALDESSLIHSFVNSTIQELLNHLIVEEWNKSIMYDKYFEDCKPKECIYTHVTRNSVIYIVTTLFGLIGGLITVLKLIIPRVVRFVAYCIRKRQVRRIVVVTMIET